MGEVNLPEVSKNDRPRYRFMGAHERKVDQPADPQFQYLLVAADPYETIGFKIPAGELEIDRKSPFAYEGWDTTRKVYTLQVVFKERETRELPALPEQVRTTNLAFHGGGGFIR